MATITGDDSSNSLVGTDSADTINAKGGNDTINGKRGNDSLIGDLGDDTYEFSGALFGKDFVYESSGGGDDTIHILSDIPASAVRLVGGHLENSATDINNLYIYVDGYGSIFIDNHLTKADVEWLKIGDSAPISLTGGLTMTGNDKDETFYGTAFNDTINGKRGNDILYGDVGDDTYEFSGALFGTDFVNESSGGGDDTIHILSDIPASAVRLVGGYRDGSATDNNNLYIHVDGYGSIFIDNHLTKADVEWLKIGDSAPISLTGGLTMTGSTSSEIIYGTQFNDTINGMSSSVIASDYLYGGLGDDTYIVHVWTDRISENTAEGNDTVNSFDTYTLSDNLENLNLIGTTAVNGTGNTLDNKLVGNSNDNQLNGAAGNDMLDGGEGNDILTGGTGDDTLQAGFGQDDLTGGEGKDAFVFYSPGDFVVHDFSKSDDLLKFDSATTGLHDLESLLGVITHIDDTPEGVAVHFVYDIASITLIGIHPADLTASMVEFS